LYFSPTFAGSQPGVLSTVCRAAVEHVKGTPAEKVGMAPVYGLAARFPMHTVVGDLLKRYLDILFKV